MADRKRLWCKNCYQETVFEWIFKDHGLFTGNHTDWHCINCRKCDYE